MDTLSQNDCERIWIFEPYTPDLRQVWDEFVRTSRNGTFLCERAYMEYHADRFEDASMLAYRKGRLVGLLPACRLQDGTLCSHAGLTYGGWILPPSPLDGAMLLEMFDEWIAHCRTAGYTAIDYKPLPDIYAAVPSQEDLYALWRCGFTMTGANLSSAIDLRGEWKFNMSKRQQLRKALKHNPVIERTGDFAPFWAVLERCLAERHEAAPVHNLQEISLLADRFPDNIALWTLSDEEGLQAGVVIYDTGLVAHSQYAATTARARDRYYLTALYHHLLTEVYASRRYFDFGTSNESGGRVLNPGLLNQKYSMGATGVLYPRFKFEITNDKLQMPRCNAAGAKSICNL